MLRTWLLAFFTCITCCLVGQSTNPFDLKYRKPSSPSPVQQPSILIDTATPAVTVDTAFTPPTTPDFSVTPDSALTDTASQNPFDKSKGQTATPSTPIDTTKSLTPAEKPGLPKKQAPNISRGFQIFFLLLSLLFLIFIVNVERSFVRDLWRVIANENYSSLHHRNQRNTMRQILLLMGYAVFIFQAGIFIFNAMRFFGYNGPFRVTIWIPMGFVLLVYIIRHSVIHYLRWLFNNQKEMTLFGFDISIFNTMVGLILLPINILILFGPESLFKPLIIIGIIAFIAAYLMRQLRWMFTARSLIANSLFLFFIYLCAVEILPLWAISKYFW